VVYVRHTGHVGQDNRRRSLLWRVLAANAAVVGTAMLVLSLSPATVPGPESAADVFVLAAGMGVIIVVNFLLLRRTLAPLRQLADLMHTVDPLKPGLRIPAYGRDAEVVELTGAFNEMLERLESERREAARYALAAQEDERHRIAQELHDEVGQGLTAALLQLEAAAKAAPPEVRGRLAETAETVRSSLEDTRRVASGLRPEALDDLGIVSALKALAKRLGEQTGMPIEAAFDEDLPHISSDEEIVVYRVAQEALTNVLRHAEAGSAQVTLGRVDGSLQLCVSDDGAGIHGAPSGGGVTGMRERAMLVGGELTIAPAGARGTRVTLDIPVGER
jgi:two-component system sensor histidine kinase UhpB